MAHQHRRKGTSAEICALMHDLAGRLLMERSCPSSTDPCSSELKSEVWLKTRPEVRARPGNLGAAQVYLTS